MGKKGQAELGVHGIYENIQMHTDPPDVEKPNHNG